MLNPLYCHNCGVVKMYEGEEGELWDQVSLLSMDLNEILEQLALPRFSLLNMMDNVGTCCKNPNYYFRPKEE